MCASLPRARRPTISISTCPSIGVVTGAGTVSPANELAFKMKADVGGMGIPFSRRGNHCRPKFVPDVKGIATGYVERTRQGGAEKPVNSVMGLFNKKKPQ